MKYILLTISILIQILSGNTLYSQVEIFAKDTISTDDVFGLTLSPDGKEAFWIKSQKARSNLKIMHSKLKEGKWTEPVIASFSGNYRDIDPFISPDGKRLLFNSARPTKEKPDKKDYDIWAVNKTKNGWGEPYNLGKEINSDSSDFYATMAKNGNIYFTSRRASTHNRLYVAKLSKGKYTQPEPLQKINESGDASNPYIDAQERFIIFLSDRKDGNDSDLYISYQENGNWTSPERLNDKVNTKDAEFCPFVSRDGKYLYFSRIKRTADNKIAEENIYRIEAKELNIKLKISK